MAERYRGRFSPGAGPANARPSRAGARVNLLFLVPFLVLLRAFGGGPVALAADLAGFGMMMLGAWLTREGLAAEDAWAARAVASRPAIPRKLFGGAAIGIGLALATLSDTGLALLEPLVLGLLGFALHALAFGPDPMRDKRPEGATPQESARVARVSARAEAEIEAMRAAIRRAGAPILTRRVDAFTAAVRRMIETVENDPRDLTRARKYLSVYLEGARAATERFADHYTRTEDAGARADFEELLADLERRFDARTEKMLLDDRSALDVEIEVLRERLAREGFGDS